MALCRCAEHGRPIGMVNTYVGYAHPVGYPDTGVICGRKDCERPGRIWLTADERNGYQQGERYFRVKTCTVKVKADDSGIRGQE